MSDESSRSAHFPDQRRSDGAPAWWAALERSDLPQDEAHGGAEPAWFATPDQFRVDTVAGMEGVPTRRRAWLINIAAVAVALAVIMIGVGVDSPRSVLVVALLFGVPIVLVGITATVAARRAR
jgi:hypothetical protein